MYPESVQPNTHHYSMFEILGSHGGDYEDTSLWNVVPPYGLLNQFWSPPAPDLLVHHLTISPPCTVLAFHSLHPLFLHLFPYFYIYFYLLLPPSPRHTHTHTLILPHSPSSQSELHPSLPCPFVCTVFPMQSLFNYEARRFLCNIGRYWSDYMMSCSYNWFS